MMPTVRLFAAAREAAGTGRDDLPGDTVADVLAEAGRRYGERFVAVLPTCKIWVNGEPAEPLDPVAPGDELAVLPPVSGGAVAMHAAPTDNVSRPCRSDAIRRPSVMQGEPW
jgi:molybdopterin converting factor small subunit